MKWYKNQSYCIGLILKIVQGYESNTIELEGHNKTSIISDSWFLVVICLTSPPADKLRSRLSTEHPLGKSTKNILNCPQTKSKGRIGKAINSTE